MQPDEHDAASLWDMLQAARSIQEFTQNTKQLEQLLPESE